MARGEELADEQRALREPLLPELPRRFDGRGRPWRSQREVLNGVRCALCDVFETLAEDLRERGGVDLF